MSIFLLKKIDVELTEKSIERAIRIVEDIEYRLSPAMMHLIEKLAEKGVEIAKANLIFFVHGFSGSDLSEGVNEFAAYSTGRLSESIHYTMESDGATITAGEGAIGGDGQTSYAMYVEFGTGAYGDNPGNHPNGWYYFNRDDGRWHHTYGMIPRPFMHNTYEELIQEVEANGGRIVAEYLGGNDGA